MCLANVIFPTSSTGIKTVMKQKIYADNAATTQLDSDAYKAMSEILQNEYSNPSQPYSFSRTAKNLIAQARETIAECINASPDEIYFTSGGTESDNWALEGTAFNNQGKAIITSQIEHHAVLRTCEFLEKQKFPAIYLPVTSNGTVLPETLCAQIFDTTSLVSVMLANNEIGTIQPIKELVEIAHSHGALFHTDAVQAVGHIYIDAKELGIDMLSASAHKFNGPKGIGFLYIKQGTNILPYMHGGAQEKGLRSGTENVAAIVGMSIALKNNIMNKRSNSRHLQKIETIFFEKLKQNGFVEGQDYIINGHKVNKLPGLISLSFNGADGEMLMHRLDLMGVTISTGAACDSVNTQVSHVLKAIGIKDVFAKGTIRLSFGKDSYLNDAAYIADCLRKVIKG